MERHLSFVAQNVDRCPGRRLLEFEVERLGRTGQGLVKMLADEFLGCKNPSEDTAHEEESFHTPACPELAALYGELRSYAATREVPPEV